MAVNKKYYVVWEGRHPGVYDNWEDALDQVKDFPGAKYKSYTTSEAAAEAFRRHTHVKDVRELGNLLTSSGRGSGSPGSPEYFSYPEIDLDGWAVDASCMGNPGIMEYRGVELMTGKELFRVGPFQDATNNIGEFLAIVHALALMARRGENHTIYSDSVAGMSWVRRGVIKTTLSQTPSNRKVFDLLYRALAWLNTHSFRARILKWQTELWGEIPADFGRK